MPVVQLRNKGCGLGGRVQGGVNEDDESKDRRRSKYDSTGFEYDECHRRREGADYSEQFRPSQTTLKSLPRFDEDNLGRFTVDVIGELALSFPISCSLWRPSSYLLTSKKLRDLE